MSAYSISYTVKPSDTLFGLALEYDVPQTWIMRINDLENAALWIGQELIIPTDGVNNVTVRPGDTLSALSMVFDVSIDEIVSENSLDSSGLRIGQTLRIPETVPDGRHRPVAAPTVAGDRSVTHACRR